MASRTKININTASVDDIIKYFKGTGTIGEKRARQIVEYRKHKGSINSVEDLVAQRIITRPIADKIRDKVEFKISSRGATRKNTKTKGKNRTNSKKVSRKKKPVKEESVLEDNSSKETEAQNVFSQEFVSYAKAQFSAIPKFKDITDNQVIEALKNPLTYAKIDAGFAKVKIAEEKKVVAAFMNERLGITESMALDYLKDENNFNMWKASYDKYLDYKHNRIIEFYVSESKSLGTEMTFDEAKAELEKHPYIYELVSDAFDKDCQSHPEKHDIKADYLCIAHNMTKDEMRNYFTNAKQKLGEAGYEQFKQGLLDNYEKTRQEMIKFMFGEFPDVDQSQMYENLDSYDMFAMLSFMSKTPQYKDKKEQIEAPSNQVQQDLQQDFTQTISEPSYEEEQLQSFSKTPEGKKGKKKQASKGLVAKWKGLSKGKKIATIVAALIAVGIIVTAGPMIVGQVALAIGSLAENHIPTETFVTGNPDFTTVAVNDVLENQVNAPDSLTGFSDSISGIEDSAPAEVNSVDLPVESTINYDETNIPVNKEDVDFNNIAYTHDDLVNGNTFDRSQILDTDWDQNLHQEKLPDGTSILYEIDDSGNRVDMGWTNSDSIGNTNDTGHGMSR